MNRMLSKTLKHLKFKETKPFLAKKGIDLKNKVQNPFLCIFIDLPRLYNCCELVEIDGFVFFPVLSTDIHTRHFVKNTCLCSGDPGTDVYEQLKFCFNNHLLYTFHYFTVRKNKINYCNTQLTRWILRSEFPNTHKKSKIFHIGIW